MTFKSLKKVLLFLVVILCFINMQCDDDDMQPIGCDFQTIIDASKYTAETSEGFSFISSEIIDDCLSFTIASSGCDGTSWEFDFIDSAAVAELFPEQRFLKLVIFNEELCDAVFQKTITFDINSLQIENSNEIILNIDGLSNALNYKY